MATPRAETSFFVTGGTLSTSATSYVVRRADTDLYEYLRAGEFCYVLNSRQMGKSSLMVRTAEKLRADGVSVAVLDLTSIGQNLTPEQWYDGLLIRLGKQLDLEDPLEDFFHDEARISPLQRWLDALTTVVLPKITGNMVIFVDEIDIVRSLPFSADEFFGAIRQCYVGRATNPELKRLTFCLLGTATPADLIQDTRTSPFNVGKRVDLQDFTKSEAAPLAEGLTSRRIPKALRESRGGRIVSSVLLDQVMYWTGGHPYLTQRLCLAVAEQSEAKSTDVDRICTELFLTHRAKETDDNLTFVRNRLLRSEVDLAALLDLYRQLRSGKRVPYDETNPLCPVLRLSGVAKVRDGLLLVRNRIYSHVFDAAWVEAHMPDAELRRQRAAYRAGLVRAIGVAAMVVLVTAGFGVFGFVSAGRADIAAKRAREAENKVRKERDAANHNLYISNMNVIQSDFEHCNFDRIADFLQTTRESKDRGFEWDYWNRHCHLDLMTLRGHQRAIWSVNFSSNGERIVTCGDDEVAKVWNSLSGSQLVTLRGHSGRIWSAVFTFDQKHILTGGADGSARVWDAQSGRGLLVLRGHKSAVMSVAPSRDGKRIITGSKDNTAKIWDANSGTEILTLKGHTDWIECAAFSPDSRYAATCSNDSTIRLWDVKTGTLVRTLLGHNRTVYSLAFSPDGKRLVSGGQDNTAYVWNAYSGSRVLTIRQLGPVHAVAFSPDGSRVATGGRDIPTTVWDASTGIEVRRLAGHSDMVSSVAFSPDGGRVVTGSLDATAKVWDANSDTEPRTLNGHNGWVLSVAFSSDSKALLTVGATETAEVWDIQTGRKLTMLEQKAGPSTSVTYGFGAYNIRGFTKAAFSPDGKHIVTGSANGAVSVWDAVTGNLLQTLKGHTEFITAVAYSATGEQIITGSTDHLAILWDARTGVASHKLRGHTGPVQSVAISLDGKRALTGSDDSTLRMWDTVTGNQTLIFRAPGFVQSVAFSSDSKYIGNISDKTATIRASSDGHEVSVLKGHTNGLTSVSFSPDGKRVLTSSHDNTAKLWDTATGREVLTMRGHTVGVWTAVFSPDGTRIATGSSDGTAKVW